MFPWKIRINTRYSVGRLSQCLTIFNISMSLSAVSTRFDGCFFSIAGMVNKNCCCSKVQFSNSYMMTFWEKWNTCTIFLLLNKKIEAPGVMLVHKRLEHANIIWIRSIQIPSHAFVNLRLEIERLFGEFKLVFLCSFQSACWHSRPQYLVTLQRAHCGSSVPLLPKAAQAPLEHTAPYQSYEMSPSLQLIRVSMFQRVIRE